MSKLKDDLSSALKSVGKDWKKAKRQADKEDRVSSCRLNRMRYRSVRETIRDAAFQVMEEAYQKASGGGRYLANARQIYYAARPKILKITGESEVNSQYFTQILLKDYLELHRPKWDVVFDARGHIIEPHTGEMIGLGGLEVRDYVAGFTDGKFNEAPDQKPQIMIPTKGPGLRYGAVLFIEKEGFTPLLEAARIAERFDVAIASTKGMPVSALCDLLKKMRSSNIKAYAVRDFDKSGFSIISTLRRGARGSTGSGEIIDLGFRLADITGLERERVSYSSNPTWNLSRNGATEGEIKILYQGSGSGERVELNAMSSDQFIEWLERRMGEYGVQKLVPDSDTLAAAYRRATFLRELHEQQIELYKKIVNPLIPDGLEQRVRDILKDRRELSWDEAVWQVDMESHTIARAKKSCNKGASSQ
jgi:DNA topoisomerase VI subunit A